MKTYYTCLLMLTVGCAPSGAIGGKTERCTLHFSTGQVLVDVPVAKTQIEQERGLSKTYDVSQGMLFVWPQADTRVFWMRDTWVPLQVGFFDANGNLSQIEEMHPNTDTRHKSNQPAMLALELGLGQFQTMGFKVGETVLLHKQCN